MPTIIQTTVYTYDELPTEKAKENARQWYLEGFEFDDEFILQEWKDEILPACGFVDPEIQYTGFWSQGDGASFTADIDFLKYCAAFGVQVRPMVRRLLESGKVDVSASIVRGTLRYYHENSVLAEYYPSGMEDKHVNLYGYLNDLCDGIQDNARAKMRELYRSLEKECDYQTSEEVIVDTILANEYTFTETGKRFG